MEICTPNPSNSMSLNDGEFAIIKSQAGLNKYKISVKELKGVFLQWQMK